MHRVPLYALHSPSSCRIETCKVAAAWAIELKHLRSVCGSAQQIGLHLLRGTSLPVNFASLAESVSFPPLIKEELGPPLLSSVSCIFLALLILQVCSSSSARLTSF
ncbi:unnamed protein product [Cercospora beticola]|nr:unnamed protein product [Cercospora beticola]